MFNVADWQLPQDVMHVLLEGVLPFEIKLLLHNFTSIKCFFSLNHFNARLESFQFGYNESKPSKIEMSHLVDGNLHQSGKSKRTFKLGVFLNVLFAQATIVCYE